MKTKLTFLIVFLSLEMNVSSQTVQTVYKLHPYTKGNQIDLTIANRARTTPVDQVAVRAIQCPQGITFKNDIQIIQSVPPQGEKTVSFRFDVGRPSKIGSNSTDTLKFLVTNRSGETWEKSIVVMYAFPTTFALEQNYPNPFNPESIIRYQVPQNAFVTIKLFDVLGREVSTLVSDEKEAGYHDLSVDASQLASGVYFYRMVAGDFVAVRKLVVMK